MGVGSNFKKGGAIEFWSKCLSKKLGGGALHPCVPFTDAHEVSVDGGGGEGGQKWKYTKGGGVNKTNNKEHRRGEGIQNRKIWANILFEWPRFFSYYCLFREVDCFHLVWSPSMQKPKKKKRNSSINLHELVPWNILFHLFWRHVDGKWWDPF